MLTVRPMDIHAWDALREIVSAFHECQMLAGELPSALCWENAWKKTLRIINEPSEHNFSNYRCSVIMLMPIHKGLLFAQRGLSILSPYLPTLFLHCSYGLLVMLSDVCIFELVKTLGLELKFSFHSPL